MFARAQFLVLLVTGLIVGVGFGFFVLAPANRPPVAPPNVDMLGRTRPAPTPMAATPTVTPAETMIVEAVEPDAEPHPPVTQRLTPPDAVMLVPSTVHERAVFDDDITLIPRGPGRFAILDMRSVSLNVLRIYAGSMERDGGGPSAGLTRRRRIGIVRGPKVRVELLHLGFDRDGAPTIAHIRTTATPTLEGLVSLRHRGRYIRVRPDRGEPTTDEPF